MGAYGRSVGLPEGFQGSSEVGHMNMGAGRIVTQEVTRINDLLETYDFFKSEQFEKIAGTINNDNVNIHLMGLLQDEGVHAHQDHLYNLLARAREEGIRRVFIHFFADGRDTPPRSAPLFLRQLEEKIDQVGIALLPQSWVVTTPWIAPETMH